MKEEELLRNKKKKKLTDIEQREKNVIAILKEAKNMEEVEEIVEEEILVSVNF